MRRTIWTQKKNVVWIQVLNSRKLQWSLLENIHLIVSWRIWRILHLFGWGLTYKLDPCQYYTIPGLSWDAGLMHSKQRLQLLSDPDTYLFIKKGIGRGITQIINRHAGSKGPHKYILYLDTNNLWRYLKLWFLKRQAWCGAHPRGQPWISTLTRTTRPPQRVPTCSGIKKGTARWPIAIYQDNVKKVRNDKEW